MSTELDEALLTGNIDDIDALLGQIDLGDDLGIANGGEDTANLDTTDNTTAVDGETGQLDVIDTTKPDTGDGDQKTDKEPEVPSNNESVREIDGKLYVAVDPENSVIASKGGKHTIPYAVLEQARNSSSDYQKRINELESQVSDATTAKQKAELLAKQLEDAGITPDKLPDELLRDPEALASIQDEVPGVVGQIITALVKQLQQTQPNQQANQNTGANDVDSALNCDELAELRGWEQGDADRWDMALVIDNKLKSDPQFEALPLQERFGEVQRRVKLAFGDPVEASIQQDIQQENANKQAAQDQAKEQNQPPAAEDKNIIPNSPGSLGNTPQDTTQAAHEALMGQDAMALEQSLSQMSPEKVEEFLANAVLALD